MLEKWLYAQPHRDWQEPGTRLFCGVVETGLGVQYRIRLRQHKEATVLEWYLLLRSADSVPCWARI